MSKYVKMYIIFKSPYSENNYNVAYGNSLCIKDGKQIKNPCGRPLRRVPCIQNFNDVVLLTYVERTSLLK